jgi:hypothetical protein
MAIPSPKWRGFVVTKCDCGWSDSPKRRNQFTTGHPCRDMELEGSGESTEALILLIGPQHLGYCPFVLGKNMGFRSEQ